jgi:putative Mg2+ transporter-C (MgtC) family protein
MEFFLILVPRLLLACVLGGIVGYERENMHRPAGFRTHILVCVGAALVMITSDYIFKQYKGIAAIDPTRLGAQVISGIGFLGAGTIIREGFNVKGLTTAASLWAVSCVGIAAGIGFYQGAIVATIIIYITLITLKRLETYFLMKNKFRTLYIQSENIKGQVGIISSVFEKNEAIVRNIQFVNSEGEKQLSLKILARFPDEARQTEIVEALQGIGGILKVYED